MIPFDIPTELKLKKQETKADAAKQHEWKKLFLAAISVAAIIVFLILGV
jgi:hypothetical protein